MWLSFLTFIIEYSCLLCKGSKYKSAQGKAAYLKLLVITRVGALFYYVLPVAFHCRMCIDRIYWPCGFYSAIHKQEHIPLLKLLLSYIEGLLVLLRWNLHSCFHILHALLTLLDSGSASLYSRTDLQIKWLFLNHLLVIRVQGSIILKVSPLATKMEKLFSSFFIACGQPSILPTGKWYRAQGNWLLLDI